MRIIIGGGGRVGSGLARALRSEEKDVVLVDNDARAVKNAQGMDILVLHCLLYTSPSPRDATLSRMPSSA